VRELASDSEPYEVGALSALEGPSHGAAADPLTDIRPELGRFGAGRIAQVDLVVLPARPVAGVGDESVE